MALNLGILLSHIVQGYIISIKVLRTGSNTAWAHVLWLWSVHAWYSDTTKLFSTKIYDALNSLFTLLSIYSSCCAADQHIRKIVFHFHLTPDILMGNPKITSHNFGNFHTPNS